MSATKKAVKPFTVLVGIDYSEQSALALTEAVAAARSRPPCHVHVVHAVPYVVTVGNPAGAPVVAAGGVATAEHSEELRKYVERVLSEPHENLPPSERPLFDRLMTHIRISEPAEAIAQLASDIEADLVVVGTHGRRGFARFLMGSVAEAVVRFAPCPVLVARPIRPETPDVPKIEPPCPRCLEARQASEGRDFWCAQHREHHERRHTYSFGSSPSGRQSGLLYPMFRS